jgi:hypothetical protein
MRRSSLAASAALLLCAMAPAAPVAAQTGISEGCASFVPALVATSSGSFVGVHPWHQGETVVIDGISAGEANLMLLSIQELQAVVDQSALPGTVQFTFPEDDTYTLQILTAGAGDLLPAELTISCIPVAPPDSDGDGVLDADDICPNTQLPDVFAAYQPSRYQADVDGQLRSGQKHAPVYSLSDTLGCSANQIIVELGVGKGHTDKGLTRGHLQAWIRG